MPARVPPLDPAVIPAAPRERRRLQCYLALLLGDGSALFAGFVVAGSRPGAASGSYLAELLLPVFLTFALYNGAYSRAALERARFGTGQALIALAMAAATVAFIALSLGAEVQAARGLFLAGLGLAALFVVAIRALLRGFVLWRCGGVVVDQLVIADGGPALALRGARRLDARQMRLVPALDDPAALHRIGLALHGADRVVVSCAPQRRLAWATILKSCNIAGEVVDQTVAELGAHGARTVRGQGLLRVSIGPLGLRARTLKRGFDLAVAGAGLVLAAPLLVLIGLAILLEDGRPVLFVQRRVGRGNRFFRIYKFRSMRRAASDGPGRQSARRHDRRVTRIGAILRRTSLDELPQLVNVLKGEMAIVGPRPHALASQAGTKLFWEVDRRYWTRHALKPGMTGLAQVRGLRGATESEADLSARLRADLEYRDGWSLWRDLQIVVRTLGVLIHPQAL